MTSKLGLSVHAASAWFLGHSPEGKLGAPVSPKATTLERPHVGAPVCTSAEVLANSQHSLLLCE